MSDLTLSLGLKTTDAMAELGKLKAELASIGLNSFQEVSKNTRRNIQELSKLRQEVLGLKADLATLQSSMQRGSGASRKLGSELHRVGHQSWKAAEGQLALHSALRGVGGAMGSLWLTYGRYVTVMAAAMAVTKSFKDSITRGMDADFQSQFVATLQAKGPPELGLKNYIRDELIDISRQSVFTVGENAEALKKLSLAGIDATNGLNLLTTASNAAIFAQTSLGDATTMVLDTLNNFNLSSDNVNTLSDNFERVANVMSYTAITVNTSFADLAKAFVNITGVAGTFNIEIEEASALLQSLAEAGVRGPKAGTYVRNFLDDVLGSPISQRAERRLDEMGVRRYNPSLVDEGEFGVAQYVDELTAKLRELDFVKQQAAIRDISNQRSRRVIRQELSQEISLVERTEAIAKGAKGVLTDLASGLTDTAKMSVMMAQAAYDAATSAAFSGNEDIFKEIGKRAQQIFNSRSFNEFLDAGVRGIGSFTESILTLIETISTFHNELRVAMQALLGLAAGGIASAITGKLVGLASALSSAAAAAKLATGATGAGAVLAGAASMVNPVGAGVATLTGIALYTNRVQRDHEAYMRTSEGIIEAITAQEQKIAEITAKRDDPNRGKGILGALNDADYEGQIAREERVLQGLVKNLEEASKKTSYFQRVLSELSFEPEKVKAYTAELARFSEQMSEKYGKDSEKIQKFVADATEELKKLRGEDFFSSESLTKEFEKILPVAQEFDAAAKVLEGALAGMEEGANKEQLTVFFMKLQEEASAAGMKAVEFGEALAVVEELNFERLISEQTKISASLQDQYNKATMTDEAYREFSYASELAAVSQLRLASAMWDVRAAEIGIDESLAEKFRNLAALTEQLANQLGENAAVRFSIPDKPTTRSGGGDSAAREYEQLTKKVQDFTRSQLEAAEAIAPLTDAQKLILEITEKYGGSLEKLTASQRAAVKALLEEAAAASASAEAFKKAKEEAEAWAKFRKEAIQPMVEANAQYEDTLENINLEIEALQAGRDIGEEVERVKRLNTIATLENNAAVYEAAAAYFALNGAQEEVVTSYARLAQEAQKGADILRQTIEKDATLAVGKEAKKFADDLEKDLSDAIMRGFEDGKGFAENFRDVLKNYFNTLVLRPMITPLMTQAAGGISGMFGGASGAQAAQGGASSLFSPTSLLTSSAGLISGVASMAAGTALGSFGAGVASGLASWGTAGATVAGTASAGLAAGGAVGAGMVLGTAVPIIGGALALASLLGKNGERFKQQGANRQGAFANGQFTATGTGAYLGDHISGVDGTLDSLNASFTSKLGLFADAVSDIYGTELPEQITIGTTTRLRRTSGRMASNIVGMIGDQAFSFSAQTGGDGDIQKGLTEFVELALTKGVANAAKLVDPSLFGGETTESMLAIIDEFVTVAQLMDDNFSVLNTEAENFTRLQQDLQAGFDRLGVNAPRSIAEFRALADGIDLTTKEGRELYASLYQLAPAFGEVTQGLQAIEDEFAAIEAGFADLSAGGREFVERQRELKSGFEALGLSVPASITDFLNLADGIDLTTIEGREMYTSLYQLAPAFIDVSRAINAVFASISDATAKSVRDIEMSVLNNAEKYRYLDTEIDVLLGRLSQATLPSEIESLFQQINSDIMSAYGLLDDSESKRLSTEFIDKLYEVEAIAQSRLSLIPEDRSWEQQTAAAHEQRAASAEQLAAAEAQMAAAAEARRAAEALFAALAAIPDSITINNAVSVSLPEVGL